MAVTTFVLSALFVPTASAQDLPVADPLPTPGASGLGLELTEVAQLPESKPVPPPTDARLRRHNRINYLGEVPDGSGRLFVPDMNGKLYLLDHGVQHAYLDLGAVVGPDFHSHRGLGSGFGFTAFHPKFARNGKFYTVHTETGSALTGKTPDLPSANSVVHGVITEWTATDPRADVFSGTHRELMRVGYASFIHGFQEIGFNPNARWWDEDYGLLYIASGDGGIGLTTTLPQDLSLPQGKILRVDPAGTNGVNGRWGIPRSNPFVGQAGKLGEIYAYGMRDPYRFSWDSRGSHKMFLGHIGEKAVDSVYEVRKGANLGWSEREGNWAYRKGDPSCGVFPLPADDAKYGYTYPVAAFDHNRLASSRPCADSGNALMGGFVYRGSKIPSLRGKYIYGEGVKGLIYYAEERDMRAGKPMATTREMMVYSGGQLTTLKALVNDPNRVDLRFGQDADGELYVLAKANGKIWKVTGARTFAACRSGHDHVSGATSARSWQPVTPALWQFPGREVVLAQPGVARPGPRRPFEYAVLKKGPEFGSVQIDAQVRLDTPVAESNRDVIIVFGYKSDTEFYYAHLSSDNKIYPHNGIFVVNNADRKRLDLQWDEARSVGAAPAVTDTAWHRVRVKHCADTGEIAVYMDGSRFPLMTAVDKTFASGRVGFGSFDNIGRLRDLRVHGKGVR
ncbi:PQQ-dependent sugar dehydrogenase [Lentzea alba]